MHPKYCLPLKLSQPGEVEAAIRHHLADYQRFEIWLDYLEGAGPEFVVKLAGEFPDRLIFHYRRQNLEPIRTALPDRLEVINNLHRTGAMVDLDVLSQAPELEYIADHKLKIPVIGSYHNYRSTPADPELQQVIAGIISYKPAVVKLAAYCQDESDAVRLLQLQLQLKAKHHKYIVLGMGPHGLATRVFGTLWGNELAFVPETSREASAPGPTHQIAARHNFCQPPHLAYGEHP